MAVTQLTPSCQKLTGAILHLIYLYKFDAVLENHSVQNVLAKGGGFH